MSGEIRSFAALAADVRSRPARLGTTRLVAVDGCGGAGKSTFASRLAAALGGVAVVHTDDIASWDVPIAWWPRLEREVLGPLAAGRTARFRPSDWVRGGLRSDHVEVPAAAVVVLEGVTASRAQVAERLSLAAWVHAPPDRRLRRGLERDGEEARDQWALWMQQEDDWFAEDVPWTRADVLVDGAPGPDAPAHEPEDAFVVLARLPGLERT